jgi:hypothetical protein
MRDLRQLDIRCFRGPAIAGGAQTLEAHGQFFTHAQFKNLVGIV